MFEPRRPDSFFGHPSMFIPTRDFPIVLQMYNLNVKIENRQTHN